MVFQLYSNHVFRCVVVWPFFDMVKWILSCWGQPFKLFRLTFLWTLFLVWWSPRFNCSLFYFFVASLSGPLASAIVCVSELSAINLRNYISCRAKWNCHKSLFFFSNYLYIIFVLDSICCNSLFFIETSLLLFVRLIEFFFRLMK